MELRFTTFSQGLAQDPTTRRIWFGIATACMPSGHRHGVIFFALALLLHVFLCCETMYNLVPGSASGRQT
jgi:hypothetical protein